MGYVKTQNKIRKMEWKASLILPKAAEGLSWEVLTNREMTLYEYYRKIKTKRAPRKPRGLWGGRTLVRYVKGGIVIKDERGMYSFKRCGRIPARYTTPEERGEAARKFFDMRDDRG